jgi:cytochrome c nitrite reductase small subunit
MSKTRIVVIPVVGVVMIGGVAAIGLWKYHEQPQFCATCHLMEPYLESWQASDYGAYAHAVQGVTCLDCHVPTVQQQVDELVVYLQGDFRAPLEQRGFGDDFCFDCHLPNEHTSEGDVVQLTAAREVNPHDSHLVGETGCETCHNMHEPSEDYCAKCHGPLSTGPGWTTEVTPTAKVEVWAPDMDCSACHVMDPYLASLQDANLLAYAHAQQGLECLDCHDVVELQAVHEQAVAGKPVTERTVTTEFCYDCHVPNEHTSYEQVIGRTTDYAIDDQNINPHDPHAGAEGTSEQYECSQCHQMHEKSPLINGCYSCHHSGTFESCSSSSCHAG